MKNVFALLVLSVSMGAMAQETVLLNSKRVTVNGNEALIVRTAKSPHTVEIKMSVPMEQSVCIRYQTRIIHQICRENRPVYRQVQVCSDRVVTVPAAPRGPRYNNPGSSTPPAPTTRVERSCRMENQQTGTVQIARDCSYPVQECVESKIVSAGTDQDHVKIKFKLPSLGGSEEEIFRISAQQRSIDGSNIEYHIVPVQTLQNREYEVVKKRILGFDSFQIQPK